MQKSHPKGLYVLFFTELWERFGFYLMSALFVLYVNEYLGWSESRALKWNGWWKCFAYMTPFFGGIFADRRFGHLRSILMGSVVLGLGYFLFSQSTTLTMLVVSLGLLVVGNGLFKPNISTMVGNLYASGDPMRDEAFSIFYAGVNIGAGIAPIVAEILRTIYGWKVAFGAASVGMLVSFLTLYVFRGYVKQAERKSGLSATLGVPLGPEYDDKPLPKQVERQKIIALVVMAAMMALFWAAFQQNDNTMPLWARDHTNRIITIPSVGMLLQGHFAWIRWEIPPAIFNAVNPVFVVLLTTPLLLLMRKLNRMGYEPSTPSKIGIGMGLTALSYLIMMVAALSGGDTGKVSLGWLVSNYLVITFAEILLSPMGLSMVTKLAPPRMSAMLMGVWFFFVALGNWFAGMLGSWFWKPWKHSSFFLLFVCLSLVALMLLLTQHRRLKIATEL